MRCYFVGPCLVWSCSTNSVLVLNFSLHLLHLNFFLLKKSNFILWLLIAIDIKSSTNQVSFSLLPCKTKRQNFLSILFLLLCCMNNSIQYTLPNIQFHIREYIVKRYFQKHLLDHVWILPYFLASYLQLIDVMMGLSKGISIANATGLYFYSNFPRARLRNLPFYHCKRPSWIWYLYWAHILNSSWFCFNHITI